MRNVILRTQNLGGAWDKANSTSLPEFSPVYARTCTSDLSAQQATSTDTRISLMWEWFEFKSSVMWMQALPNPNPLVMPWIVLGGEHSLPLWNEFLADGRSPH